jgi:hypothetical protein
VKRRTVEAGAIVASKIAELTARLEALAPRREGQFWASIDPASADAVIAAEKKLLFGDVETGSAR